ncbi:MAG: hypothetical protein GY827_05695 [Cytophagales bacterium]|nr:hypothetical protein [Cytophagales bacterium]
MKNRYWIIIVGLFVLISCRRLEDVSWQTQNVVPIAKSSLTISQLLSEEDSSLTVGDDNVLTFVHQEFLDTLRPLDSLVNLEVAPFDRTVTINSLALGTQGSNQSITLGDILTGAGLDNTLRNGAQLPGALINFALAGTGGIPDLDPIDVDVSEFFKTAVLQEGKIKINVDNQLPFDLTQMDISIQNKSDGTVIYEKTITNIDSKTTFDEEDDLAALLNGQAIEGNLEVFVSNVEVEASKALIAQGQSIPINYEDYISIGFEIYDIKVESATAIFPEQDVVNTTNEVPLIDSDGFDLTFTRIKQGSIKVRSTSTIQDTVYFWYEIPSATLNGAPFQVYVEIPPSENGESVVLEKVFPFNGYDFDLTGLDGTNTNNFYNTLRGSIKQSEEIISLSLLDTISLQIEIDKMVPEYVEGYLGQEEFSTGLQTIPVDLTDVLPSGDFTFETVNTSLVFQNSLGIDGQVIINTMQSKNEETNEVVTISPTGDLLIASGEKQGDVYKTITSEAVIENTTELFNSKPSEISFDLDVKLNPEGNNNSFRDYIHESNQLVTSIEIELPLSIAAENLTLLDTTTFLEETLEIPAGLTEGTLSIIANNQFPLDVGLTLYFLDANYQIVDSLVSSEFVKAGIPNESTNKVEETTYSKVDFTVERAQLERIVNTEYIVFKAVMDTEGEGYQKIYDDYSLDFSIVGDFFYTIEGNSLKQ